MGRIVIPRPRRMGGLRAPTPLSALRGRSKSRGFDASDLQMVSKALDMAVAIGGGIAGAIQRAGEDDRASTRGSTGGGYLLPPGTDARILEDRRARRAAAEEATGGEVSGDVEAFFAQQTPDVRDRLPGLGGEFTLDAPLVQQRPTPAGPLSPGVLAMPGSLAPEDISALRSTAQLMQHQSNMAQQMAAAEALDPNRPVGRPGVPARLFTHPESPQADFGARLRAQAPDIAAGRQMLYGDDPEVAAALGAAPARRMLAPPLAQYAPQSAPPVPQAPPMPMATPQPQFIPGGGQANALGRRLPSSMGRLMAMAPFVRTQADADRLMQAVATSPDVQPSGWQDALSRDYVKRAQAQVAALMPKGLGRGPKPVTALDMARLEQTRERTELIRMQQKMAQAKLDEEAAKAERRANAVRKTNPELSRNEALYAFYTKNWPRMMSGEMGADEWSERAGELVEMTPSGLEAWARNNKLSRATRKSANATAGRLLQMRPKPEPKPPGAVTPPVASGLRKDLVGARSQVDSIMDQISKLDGAGRKADKLNEELVRARRRQRYIEEQLDIISPTPGPDAPGPAYNAPTYIPGQRPDIDLTKPPKQR